MVNKTMIKLKEITLKGYEWACPKCGKRFIHYDVKALKYNIKLHLMKHREEEEKRRKK